MKFKDQYGKTHNRLISAYSSDIKNFLKGNVKTSPFEKDTIKEQTIIDGSDQVQSNLADKIRRFINNIIGSSDESEM